MPCHLCVNVQWSLVSGDLAIATCACLQRWRKNIYRQSKNKKWITVVDYSWFLIYLQSPRLKVSYNCDTPNFRHLPTVIVLFNLNYFQVPFFSRVSQKCLLVIIRFSNGVNTVTEQPYYTPTRNRHYRGCQDNQPWFTEPQKGLHLGLEALAMRLSRCCASQPITGELAEKDDIIGKLGQMQWVFWLSCPPVYVSRGTIILKHYWQINSIWENRENIMFKILVSFKC